MHGRLLRDEIPVYDYLIELAPFALVFMTTRELSYMGSSDSLLLIREKPQILIMGDFNDTPQDRSISEIFAAQAFPLILLLCILAGLRRDLFPYVFCLLVDYIAFLL